MIVKPKALTQKAHKGGYAIGAFDCPTLESIQAVIQAAENKNAPVIVMATENDLEYMGLEEFVALTTAAAKKTHIPVVLHLDHGKNIEIVKAAIGAGFSSVMIDASSLPFEENVALTKRVVDYAHKRGVYVQGEFGSLLEHALAEDPDQPLKELTDLYTDPDMAEEFVKKTKVDTLAVAIGNLHGILKYRIRNPRLDFNRLKEISKRIKVPLVMHGSSKISDSNLRRIVRSHVSVFNFRTEYFLAFTKELRRELSKHPDEHDPRRYMVAPRDTAMHVVEQKIALLGSTNKAK